MPQPPKVKTFALLRPLSWLYATVMQLRNRRFDNGGLRVESFGVRTISVGNISVGGTGKTPMCGYLLSLLDGRGHHCALLSRGYGRKTHGYQKATNAATAADVGDEPLQLYHQFGGRVGVYACERRCEGARRLLQDAPYTEVLVLDDAYQHRYIDRDLNILLTDYSRLYTRDRVMPEGHLRERPEGARRADVIVVTKCPRDLTTADAAAIRREINPLPHQHLFFATVAYEPLPIGGKRLFAFTGIAKPQPLIDHLRHEAAELTAHTFADHHAFTPADLDLISQRACEAQVVVTTAKDYSRLPQAFIHSLADKLMVQHIRLEFLFGQEQQFDELVVGQATTAS